MSARPHTELPLQTRLAPIASVSAQARTAEVIWTTGARVKRFDFERGNFYLEELSLLAGHVRMARLQAGAPLLNAHNRWSLADVIGVVESATIAAGEGRASVRFSEREDVEPIFRDVKGKILRNVSAGYITHRMQMLPPDEKSEGLPIYRAVDWEPVEISIVPVGADAGAGVRSEARTYPCIFETKEDTLSKNEEVEVAEVAASENARSSPAEMYRTKMIGEICRTNGISDSAREGFLTRGDSVTDVRRAVLAIAAERTERAPIRSGVGPESAGDRDPRLNLITEALAARFGGPKAGEEAGHFMHMRTLDIARLCLENRGVRTTLMPTSEIVRRALHSTGDFPELLTGTGRRVLRASYLAHQSGISKVFQKTTSADFRAKNVLALSEAPTLLQVGQGGEFQSGTMAETKESYVLKTYGRIFGLTRQGLINDDLNAFGEMFVKFGQSAAELEASTLTTLINSNPTLSTGNGGFAVFSTGNNNLSLGTIAINVDTLGTGVKKIRLQQGISGNIALGLSPRYLVVPAALEQTAKQYTSTGFTPALPSSVNPWNATLEAVVEPRLDALDATKWYLFADPAIFPCFQFAHLEGEEGPMVESRVGWEVDGMEIKCRIDLGAGAIEYRGGYRAGG